MAMLTQEQYKQFDFKLAGLNGISDAEIQVHLGLYAGYVKNTNLLNETISQYVKQGKAGSPEYAETTRRLGFEYAGMILHEYYFGNLKPNGGSLDPNSPLAKAISQSFGSYDGWIADFKGIAGMRGVGWAILYQDPANGWLSNHWVNLHQDGNPPGFKPILVLDVWEHAFMVDYKPPERSKYIEAFFQNVDWSVVQNRLTETRATRPIG